MFGVYAIGLTKIIYVLTNSKMACHEIEGTGFCEITYNAAIAEKVGNLVKGDCL